MINTFNGFGKQPNFMRYNCSGPGRVCEFYVEWYIALCQFIHNG